MSGNDMDDKVTVNSSDKYLTERKDLWLSCDNTFYIMDMHKGMSDLAAFWSVLITTSYVILLNITVTS